MTNEQIGKFRREALPWGAIIASVAFAWSAVGQLVAVRDDLLNSCHAMDVRVTRTEQWVTMHEQVDNQFRVQVIELIQAVRELTDESKKAP